MLSNKVSLGKIDGGCSVCTTERDQGAEIKRQRGATPLPTKIHISLLSFYISVSFRPRTQGMETGSQQEGDCDTMLFSLALYPEVPSAIHSYNGAPGREEHFTLPALLDTGSKSVLLPRNTECHPGIPWGMRTK